MHDGKSGPFIVGFNGPPRSGKDTIATALVDLLEQEGVTTRPIHRLALASTMRNGAAAILGMDLTDRKYSEIKDKPLPIPEGVTFRQFMIDLSESFVKTHYGQDFWSRLMHHRNRIWWDSPKPQILIVTDIGFAAEVNYFCEHSSFYLNVVLSRKHTDFTGDSRKHVWVSDDHYCADRGANFALTNDETPEAAAQEVARILYKFGFPVFG